MKCIAEGLKRLNYDYERTASFLHCSDLSTLPRLNTAS